jgi:hypothetical protein
LEANEGIATQQYSMISKIRILDLLFENINQTSHASGFFQFTKIPYKDNKTTTPTKQCHTDKSIKLMKGSITRFGRNEHWDALHH